MQYVYETHLHTSRGSLCGRSTGEEYVRFYKNLGYAGIIVTEHFIHGNCAVDPDLSWKRFVSEFMKSYEETREAGERAGLSVFFGWEETFDGDDYLIYGLDGEWLTKNPQVAGWSRSEQYREVRRHGGCVVQAHPFRDRHYIPAIHLSPGCVDAFEVGNAGNLAEHDQQAYSFAKKNGLVMTAGTDIHFSGQFSEDQMMGVAFDKPLESIHDYVDAILGHRPFTLRIPRGRLTDQQGGPPPVRLPVTLRSPCGRRFRMPDSLF